MNYHSINDLVELCHKNNAQLWQVIMMDNAHERMVSEDKIFENMRLMYKAMKLQIIIMINLLSHQAGWQVVTES